jgi:hypothetical protein
MRSTSRTIRSVATRRSTIPIPTSASSTTPPLAVAADVRRLVVADGHPVRDEPASPGRERGRPAHRLRAGAREDDDGSGAAHRQDRRRRGRIACAPDERRAKGVRPERHVALRRPLVVALPRRVPPRSRGLEEAAEEEATRDYDDDRDDYDATTTTATTTLP